MKAYISINAQVIRSNAIHGTDNPPIRIAKSRSDKKPIYAKRIEITGTSTLEYDPNRKIMVCGARMVLVAPRSGVRVIE